MNDLRYAFRQLAKSPGFTAVVVAILALGIGANTAIFSMVSALMLRPLPYDRPDELVAIYENLPSRNLDAFSVAGPKYLEWRKRNTVFQEMGALAANTQSLIGTAEPVSVLTCQVSPSYLRVWRMRTTMGRLFADDEDRAEKRDVAVLTHSLWQRRFDGRRDILGSSIRLDGRPHTVIGVTAPGGLIALEGCDMVFVPLAAEKVADGPGVHYYQVAARLKPGVTVAQSQEAMTALADALRKEDRRFGDWGVVVRSMRADLLGGWPDPRTVLLLEGAVVLVLFVACANTANLLLARAAARRKEIAIRLSLGGSRGRIIRQLLTESVLLSLLGGVAGVVLATFVVDAANLWLEGRDFVVWSKVVVDRAVLAFSLGLSVVTGVLFGLVPAWQTTKPDVQSALRGAGQNATAGVAHRRMLDLLAVAEIALALVLLVGAGLFVRTLSRWRQTPLGFDPASVIAVQTSLTELRHASNVERSQFVSTAVQRLQALPGVDHAAAIDVLPMGGNSSWDLYIVGRPRNERSSYGGAEVRRISPEYFPTMSVPLHRGRGFTAADAAGAPAVAIINTTVAHKYFPNVDPIGCHIELGDGIANPKTIVGVVPDERVTGVTATAPAIVYVPLAQGWFKGSGTSYGVNFVVHTDGKPAALAKSVQRELRALDPDLAFARLLPMSRLVDATLMSELMRSGLLTAFSAIALLLAALGVYGVMANSVSQRANEFGVRLALGANPAAILRLVFRRGLLLIAAGAAVGLAAALAGTRLLRSFLHDISPTDALTFTVMTLFLAAVAGVAIWLPARRATRVNPVEALRAE